MNSLPTGRLWFLWPFYQDTLEPLIVAIALGSVLGSFYRGDPNMAAVAIVLVSYAIALTTRRPRRDEAMPVPATKEDRG